MVFIGLLAALTHPELQAGVCSPASIHLGPGVRVLCTRGHWVSAASPEGDSTQASALSSGLADPHPGHHSREGCPGESCLWPPALHLSPLSEPSLLCQNQPTGEHPIHGEPPGSRGAHPAALTVEAGRAAFTLNKGRACTGRWWAGDLVANGLKFLQVKKGLM